MSQHYLLRCECGRTLRVEPRQAGELLACECGNAIRVPPLRQLRQLPRADSPELPGKTAWTQTQGITFVSGAVVTAIALVVFAYVLTERLRLDIPTSAYDRFLEQEDVESLVPEDSWMVWQAYRDLGLQWDHLPKYVTARRRATTLNGYLAIAGGGVLVGGCIVLCSLLLRRATRGPTPAA